MSYQPLKDAVVKTPAGGIEAFNCGAQIIRFFVDRNGVRYFSLKPLAALCRVSTNHLRKIVQEQYGRYLKEAVCCVPAKPSFDADDPAYNKGYFVAEPCFVYLVYSMPQLANLRRFMEKRAYPDFTWTYINA